MVSRAYPEFAAPHHVPLDEMMRMICDAGLRVVVHRRFQLLPMWGDRPSSIRWLMHPRVIQILSKRIGGRMLDEWISSVPILRRYAFRHVFVCEKTA
jgi:hypothetical protein